MIGRPAGTVVAYLTDAPAGATVGVKITDLAGGTVAVARSTTGITEYPAGSTANPSDYSIYTKTLVLPSTAGTCAIVWDVNGAYAVEDLHVRAFTAKTWVDYPSTSTPITAAALIDLETRVTSG